MRQVANLNLFTQFAQLGEKATLLGILAIREVGEEMLQLFLGRAEAACLIVAQPSLEDAFFAIAQIDDDIQDHHAEDGDDGGHNPRHHPPSPATRETDG